MTQNNIVYIAIYTEIENTNTCLELWNISFFSLHAYCNTWNMMLAQLNVYRITNNISLVWYYQAVAYAIPFLRKFSKFLI